MAKALVFVLVPYSAGPSRLYESAFDLLLPHQITADGRHGRFDYLFKPEALFDDPVTEGALPDRQKRPLHRTVCDVSRLQAALRPYAIVTPDGVWHAGGANIRDFDPDRGYRGFDEAEAAAVASWPLRCEQLLAAHPDHWVVAFGAHW